MQAHTVLILGGGVGGVVAANALRKRLHRRHRILLVDREPIFTLAASFLWLMNGSRKPEHTSRPLGGSNARASRYSGARSSGSPRHRSRWWWGAAPSRPITSC
jgi:sulfide:quinone oxidoreductase